MASPWDDRRIELGPTAEPPFERMEFKKGNVRRTAWLEYVAVRAGQRTLGLLPMRILLPLLGGFARCARRLDGRHARPAREFVRTVLPRASQEEIDRMVTGAYRHLARVAVEADGLHRLLGTRLGEHYDVEVCDGLEDLVASGQGILALTAHVGFWEGVGPPLFALGFPMVVAVGKPPNNPYLARWIQTSREAQGGWVLPRDGAIKGVNATVRSGGVAVLLLDQRPHMKSIQVPFFGRLAHCDRSAGVLVRRAGAPVVVMGCYMTPRRRRYKLVFQRVIQPAELAGKSPEEVMLIVNQETEALVRRQPDQYFWLHDRFKGAPAP